MSAMFSALLVLIVLEKAGASVKPIVTFTPNWDKIFTTESLTMTCDVRSPMPPDMSYDWYKNNNWIHTGQSFIIESASIDHRGSYQCKGTNTAISDPVRLEVSNDWVILQVPLYVHERDDVTLRCHHYPRYDGGQTTVYKNNAVMGYWKSYSMFQIKDINVEGSHKYKCTKYIKFSLSYYEHRGETSITIKELFTTPEIKVTPFPVTEGDNVTVTCHTNVSPYRPQTELQFSFYKDGRNVLGFGSPDQYGFQLAQLQNSGNYYCEVKTVSGRPIVKRSKELFVEINVFFTQPEIIMTPNYAAEGDNMTLTCHTRHGLLFSDKGLEFAFYRDGQKVQEFNVPDQYELKYAQPNHSGNYSCIVWDSSSKLTKSSKEVYIQIQELFSQPEIKMIPDVVIEGDQIIFTCNTSVTRIDTELHFAFYKNDQNFQKFNSSHRYKVVSAQMRDSGSYFCEVRSSTNNVIKRSEELHVDIQELFSQPEIRMIPDVVIEGDQIIFTCNTSVTRKDTELHFAFYKNEQNFQKFNSSHRYKIVSAQMRDSGSYFCEVRSSTNNIIKRSEELHVDIQGQNEYHSAVMNAIRLMLSGFILITSFIFIHYHMKFMKSLEPQ